MSATTPISANASSPSAPYDFRVPLDPTLFSFAFDKKLSKGVWIVIPGSFTKTTILPRDALSRGSSR